MNRFKLAYFIFIAWIFASCATVVAPEGGAKDTTPPIALEFQPPLGSKEMHQSQIEIRFDEFIVLNKLQEQLVVSPPMDVMPEVHTQGKKLIINLPDSLRDETTYTLFFGNAIANFKENLETPNFSYHFSTGSQIDSLELSGTALRAFDLNPYEDLYIILHKNLSDSNLQTQRPYYLTRANKDGSYLFSNLAEGEYQLFALKDLNRNFIYDQPAEEVAFCSQNVMVKAPEPAPTDSLDSTQAKPQPVQNRLMVFTPKPEKSLFLSHKVLSANKILHTFNRNPGKIEMIPLNFVPQGKWHHEIYNLNGDSITSFLIGVEQDTLKYILQEDGVSLDTLKAILVKRSRASEGRKRGTTDLPSVSSGSKKSASAKVQYQYNFSQTLDFFDYLRFNFTTPLASFKIPRIEVYQAQDTLWKKIPITMKITDTLNQMRFAVEVGFSELEKYKVVVRDSTFFDIYGNTNDSLVKEFSTTEMREYGSFKLILDNTKAENLIIQLLNDKDAVLEEHKVLGAQTIIFPHLNDGKYKIKAIVDANNNGRWDNGYFIKRIQPEKVFYFPHVLDIRANWDIEQTWIIEP